MRCLAGQDQWRQAGSGALPVAAHGVSKAALAGTPPVVADAARAADAGPRPRGEDAGLRSTGNEAGLCPLGNEAAPRSLDDEAGLRPRAGPPDEGAVLGWAELGRLMPMFLALGPAGEILATGPTLRRLLGEPPPGARFEDLFLPSRSGPGTREGGMGWLAEAKPRRLELVLAGAMPTRLRAHAVPARFALGPGWLLNLGFGLAVAEAVAGHALTDADFAPTDPTVDMLYLLEAKSAVAAELRGLALRLDSAHRAALARSLADPLTGLGNRRAFEMAFDEAIRRARRNEDAFALAHLDLDHFKQVNDAEGHAAGDRLLVAVAEILREEIRARDQAARIGGDEFVLLLRGGLGPAEAVAICERIIARIVALGETQPEGRRVSGSFGIALSRDRAPGELGGMADAADRALYASKAAGRGVVTLAAPLARDGRGEG
ncbi:GGDEF domain-containing protein [Frigidibacter sp. MR17.14]|uniref:GGDEF domain-containing protein n=1 Tax=Frigidibacter sp. MR17.14 TaxID=3126509 RepID=UPI0030130AF6